MTRYRVYTGPTLAHSVAVWLREQNVVVKVQGTEHVFVDTNLDPYQFLGLLNSHFSGFRPRDVQAL